jgi:recombinational DNA repair protein RecR
MRKQQKDTGYYSPPFSQLAAVSVRRLAWAMGTPMSGAVDHMVKLMPSIMEPIKICSRCKDNTKCQACIFSEQLIQQQKAAPAAL